MSKIKVVHIFGKLNRGGAETMIMNIYRKIDRSKYEFSFVVHGNEIGAYEKEILDLGGNIYRVPKYKIINHLEYKKDWKKIFQKLDSTTIVHAHMRSTANIFLKIAKKIGFKTIFHSHSTSTETGFIGIIKKYNQKSALKYTDKRVSCGEEAGKWLFGENSEFTIIPNAVDVRKLMYDPIIREEYRKYYKLDDSKVLISIARFNSVKNHSFIIDILKDLKSEDCVKLVLVGDGPLKHHIERKVVDLKLEDKVIFMGVREDISELLSMSDIFLMPSLYEGLPLSLIEAQSAGIKVFLSDVITDELNETNTLTYLPLDDIKIWINTISKTKVNDNHTRISMNKIMFMSDYEISKSLNIVSKIYEAIVDNL